MDAPIELYRIAKTAPTKLKRIGYYNVLNFWSSLILSFIGLVVAILVMPAEQLTLKNFQWTWILVLVIILNYYIVKINIDFIRGSKKAYWILLICFMLQCLGFQVGDSGFDFELGGIPVSFTLQLGSQYLKVNIAAMFATSYLLSIKSDYMRIMELKELKTKEK